MDQRVFKPRNSRPHKCISPNNGPLFSDFLVLKNVKVENSGRAKGSTFPTFSEDKVKSYFKNNKIALKRDQDQLMNITCIPHFGG